MNNKRKSELLKLSVLILTIITMMIPNSIVFASTEDCLEKEITTKGTFLIIFDATSNTSATSEVSFYADSIATSIKSTITLQSAPLGSSNYSNVSGISPSTRTVYNTTYIYHTCNFNISSQKDYRIKVEISQTINGINTTTIRYKTLVR